MAEKVKLAETRKKKGLSQEEVAKLMNMDKSCYSKREKGKTKIKFEEWLKLSKILNVHISEIYEPDDEQSIIFNDKGIASVNYFGTNTFYNNTEPIIEKLLNFITKLQEENRELKEKTIKNRTSHYSI